MSPFIALAADIGTAPAASDNNSVLLWLVGFLTFSLLAVAAYLKNKISENEIKCLKDQEICRADMSEMHKKVETLLSTTVAEQAKQTHAVVQALNRVCDEIGSGKHPKVQLP